jgi:hypothetical protein
MQVSTDRMCVILYPLACPIVLPRRCRKARSWSLTTARVEPRSLCIRPAMADDGDVMSDIAFTVEGQPRLRGSSSRLKRMRTFRCWSELPEVVVEEVLKQLQCSRDTSAAMRLTCSQWRTAHDSLLPFLRPHHLPALPVSVLSHSERPLSLIKHLLPQPPC